MCSSSSVAIVRVAHEVLELGELDLAAAVGVHVLEETEPAAFPRLELVTQLGTRTQNSGSPLRA